MKPSFSKCLKLTIFEELNTEHSLCGTFKQKYCVQPNHNSIDHLAIVRSTFSFRQYSPITTYGHTFINSIRVQCHYVVQLIRHAS